MEGQTDNASPFEMMTATDILAMKRVLRLLGRIRAEGDRHRAAGHDDTCPFANRENAKEVEDVGDTLHTWIHIYEQEHGEVPILPTLGDTKMNA